MNEEKQELKKYSQNDEELYIVEHLKKAGINHGSFLDIGAYDGKAFSNTYRLVLDGWTGVCIEPSPTVFPALLNLHADNPKIELINAAISTSVYPGLIEFFDSGGDAISTTSHEHREKWQRGYGTNYKKFLVWSLPLKEVWDRYGTKFTFVNIDTENTNLEIFKQLPLDRLTEMRVICIEHDNRGEEIAFDLASHGFSVIHTNGENIILAR